MPDYVFSAAELAIISRESWEREGTFDKDGHDSEITTLSFSPNGRYLSSSGKDEKILVWDCSTRRVVLQFPEASGPVSSLAWRPGAGSNSISYIDKEGNLVRWDDVIAEKLAHPNDAPAAGAASRSSATAAVTKSKPSKASRDMDLDEDDLDLDIGGNAGQPDMDDDEDDFIEDDDDDGVYKSRFNNDDDDDLAMPAPLVSSKSKGGSSVVVSSGGSRGTGCKFILSYIAHIWPDVVTSASLVKGQDPFQPGATPLKDKRRYLAFNMLGVIHIVERDSHNIVEIDFHDQSTHGRIHFDDFSKFSLASLGPQGAVYASSSKDLGSTVAFKPFDSWGSSSAEWSLDLPSGELATCLAISSGVFVSSRSGVEDEDALDSAAASGSVIVATTSGYLRFFSATGTQKYIINLGEQVVTLAAGKDWAMVVHRTSELIQPGKVEGWASTNAI
jgi:chromosome transmission fidelity protein 4